MDTAHTVTESSQFLTFTVAGEEYAVSILKVREIVRYDAALTTVPTMPAWVRGVINLRGSVVPVVDLAVKFGVPTREVTKRTCVVVMEVSVSGEQTVMGVVVDAVSEVRDFSANDVEPSPSFGTPIRGDLLRGLGRVGERFVLILDIDRVLSSQAQA